MKREEKDRLESVVGMQGFDYAMLDFSDHTEIKDPEFHRRLTEYRSARASLEFYVMDDVEGIDS